MHSDPWHGAAGAGAPDLLGPQLHVLYVGFDPSLRSGATGLRCAGQPVLRSWGLQPGNLFAPAADFVLSSPSGLVRLPFEAKLQW